MQLIWRPGARMKMHIQWHDAMGNGHNQALCGLIIGPSRTINYPFALGRPICKHCRAVALGRRKAP